MRSRFRKFRGGAAALAIVLGAAIGVPIIVGNGGGSVTTLYLLPSGTDTGSCPSTAPCRTFGYAYQHASQPANVLLLSGSYPAQTVSWDASKTSTSCDGWVSQRSDVTPITSGCITFTPAPGASVSFTGDVSLYSSGIRLLNLNLGAGATGHNVNINDGSCNAGAGNSPGYIIIDGVQAHRFGADYANHVALLNSTLNPNDTSGPAIQLNPCDPDNTGPLSYPQPNHLRIADSVIENVIESAGHHDECLHATDAGATPSSGGGDLSFIVITRTRWLNCAEQDISIQTSGPSPNHDILIENSSFAAACSEQPVGTGNSCGAISTVTIACAAAGVGGTPYTNIDFRFNSMSGSLLVDPTVPNCSALTSWRIYGNVGGGYTSNFSCNARTSVGLTYRYNVFEGAGVINCGGATNTVAASEQMVDPSTTNGSSSAYDFHLSSCANTAANFILPAALHALGSGFDYPVTDYAGAVRPLGSSLDVGAYEACS